VVVEGHESFFKKNSYIDGVEQRAINYTKIWMKILSDWQKTNEIQTKK